MPYDQPVKFLRIDTAATNVYVYTDNPSPSELLVDSLSAKPGDSFIREGWKPVYCLNIDTSTVLGIETIVKKFMAEYVYGASYSLAFGLGLIQYITAEDDPCRPLLDSYYTDMVYAKINGEEFGTFVDIKEHQAAGQISFKLEQNFPNPFNPGTSIRYSISEESDVTLKIFNILGEEIAALLNVHQVQGVYEIKWNAENYPSGIYFYQLKTNNGYLETKKMIILK